MTADEFMRKMIEGAKTFDHPEFVCEKCGSKNVVMMKALNSVIGCQDCGLVVVMRDSRLRRKLPQRAGVSSG